MAKKSTRMETQIILMDQLMENGKRKLWRDWNFDIQTVIVVTALILATLSATIISSFMFTAGFMEDANQQKVVVIAETLAESIKDFIDLEDKKLANRSIQPKVTGAEKKNRNSGFEHIYILDAELKILASMSKDKKMVYSFFDSLEIGKLKESKIIDKWDTTLVAVPILYGKKQHTLGTVVIEFNDGPITRAHGKAFRAFLVIFLVAIFVAIPAFWFFIRKQSEPIRQLGEAAEQVADGHYDVRVEHKKGHNDIAQVMKSFNRLLDSIEIYVEFSPASFVQKVRDGKLDPKASVVEEQAIGLCDAVDFSDFADGKEPQVITDHMDAYYEVHGRIAEEFCGEIEKYMGDSVMDYFGEGEEEREIFARNAILAKFATQQFFSIANCFFRDSLEREILHWRYAVATGKVQRGPLGYSRKRDYTRMGVTVNLAARLEDKTICDSGGLAVDKFTFKNAGGNKFLVALKLTEVQPKGFKEKVEVYKVTALRDPAANERVKQVIMKLFDDEELKTFFCKVKFNEDDSDEVKQDKVELRRRRESEYQDFLTNLVIPYLSKTDLTLPVPISII